MTNVLVCFAVKEEAGFFRAQSIPGHCAQVITGMGRKNAEAGLRQALAAHRLSFRTPGPKPESRAVVDDGRPHLSPALSPILNGGEGDGSGSAHLAGLSFSMGQESLVSS